MNFKVKQLFEKEQIGAGKISWIETRRQGETVEKIEKTDVLVFQFNGFHCKRLQLLIIEFDEDFFLYKTRISSGIRKDVYPEETRKVFQNITSGYEACKKAVEYIESFRDKFDGREFDIEVEEIEIPF